MRNRLQDLYLILQVSENASSAEIKRAYRRLARTYHPDLLPEGESDDKMQALNMAYGVLGDEEKRRRYDYLRTLAALDPPNQAPAAASRRPYPPNFVRKSVVRNRERELVIPYLGSMEKLMYVLLCFSALLLIDLLLPAAERMVEISSVGQRAHTTRSGEYVVSIEIITSWGRYTTDRETGMAFVNREFALLEYSPLLHQRLRLLPYAKAPVGIRAGKSLYGNFAFFPILMILMALGSLNKKSSPEGRFGLGVGSLFMAVICFFLL